MIEERRTLLVFDFNRDDLVLKKSVVERALSRLLRT